MKPDTPLEAFARVLVDDMTIASTKRITRRARWNAAVRIASASWRESFGYKLGPIIDHRMVKREAQEMVALVMKARLLMLFAPMFVMVESIDRSLHIISILASPSGNGPERYAPKLGGPERISVQRHAITNGERK